MNSTRLFTNVQPGGGGTATSPTVYVQGVRDSLVTFWVRVDGPVSGKLEIRGMPDSAAGALTTPAGAVLHTIIWVGTAGANQTKTDANGHAVVTLQAEPQMFLYLSGVSGSEVVNAWIIE